MRATALIEGEGTVHRFLQARDKSFPNIACHFGRGGTTGVNIGREGGGGGGVVDNKAFTLLHIYIPTRRRFSNEHATK